MSIDKTLINGRHSPTRSSKGKSSKTAMVKLQTAGSKRNITVDLNNPSKLILRKHVRKSFNQRKESTVSPRAPVVKNKNLQDIDEVVIESSIDN